MQVKLKLLVNNMPCKCKENNRRQRKLARERTKMPEGEKLIKEGEILHVLLPHSIRYIFNFTAKDEVTRQYIGEIPNSYVKKDTEFEKLLHNAIVFATHWC